MTVCLILVAVVFLLFWLFLGGDFSGNAEEEGEPPQIACMEVRVREVTADDLVAKQIEVKGPFPFEAYGETAGLIVSVFDCTGDELHPVLSAVEAFQEPYTIAYDDRVKVGDISPGTGLRIWTPVGIFIPDIMLGPHGGHRQLVAVVRLVDVHAGVIIRNGSVIGGRQGIFWTGKAEFACSLGKPGYIGFEKQRRKLQAVMVKLAAAIAMADGAMDADELQVLQQKIKQWLERAESYYDGLTEAQRTKSYEKMIQRALTKAQDRQINTDDLLNRLRRHRDQKLWYEVLELCMEVMAADGIADIDELLILRKIGDASGIDANEIQKLRDQKIVDLEIRNQEQTPIEELLGIDADWDLAKIQRHLQGEYKKWNSRLNMVSEGKARQNAQIMLNMIGEAYKDYTSQKKS